MKEEERIQSGGEHRLEGTDRTPVVYRAVHRALEGGERAGQEEAREVNNQSLDCDFSDIGNLYLKQV